MSAAVLGIERSLSGRRWRSRVQDDRLALALAQRLAVPEVVGRVLAARGVALDRAERFLNPSLREDLPDPLLLKDMGAAVDRLARAVTQGETVAVFGDYDVDGATSSALLVRFLGAVGARCIPYIPDRMKEGYGPNTAALLRLRAQGAAVVVTVDCGVSAHEPLAAARAAGLEPIVIDHHLPGPSLPPGCIVVDPNRLDEAGGLGQLAAVGVAFLLVVALNRALRRAGWFAARPEPDLMAWLDLVAVGTVCDAVPLTGLNRAFVTQGLRVLARRTNVGLAALADVARFDQRPGTYHAGFLLGPRINAGGRVGEPDLGVRLLCSEDPAEARRLAETLDRYNDERKAIEAKVQEAAIQAVEAGPPRAIAFAAGAGWHPGVVGIVAARLVERFQRPAFVVGIDAGVGKGSGRSVPGVDIGAAVIAARQAGLLLNGGGHAAAAGLTVDAARMTELATFLDRRLAAAVAEHAREPSLGLDGTIAVGAATRDLLELVARAGPYGQGNAEPRFAVTGCRIVRAEVVGGDHVRCIVAGEDGGRLKAIAFRHAGSAVGRAMMAKGGGTLHLAGTLRAESWREQETVQLVVEDAAVAVP